MTDLPEGTVTFLMTDIEGSSRMWERDPKAAGRALAIHDAIIEGDVERNGGIVIKPRGEGDSRFAVFRQASDAVAAAVATQQDLAAEKWPSEEPLRVRMALHTGEADLRLGDYYGTEVNRCARIRSIGHGGQTLLSHATRQLTINNLPDGVTLRDMGRHRLKDLARPEHIFQLVIPQLQADFPTLQSLSGVAHNLPAQVTELVGRESELAEIQELLLKTRLLTLTGPGGIGKTRLSIEVASRCSANFADGAFFVPLAPLSSAEQLVQATTEALDLSIAGGTDLKAQLLRYLRNKGLLLVMDNFEHLMKGVAFVVEILEAAPRVSVMVTSREKLNLSGETLYPVLGLDYSDWQTPEEAMVHSAARLFVQSAKQARPGFELNQEDVRPVARMCQLIDGMPLGILLAAAWIDLLSPGEIVAEIEKSLDFLESSLRDLPPRQRSLRAVFETSWDRLDKDERDIFKILSVFRGGFTREAAGEVAGATLRDLARLDNKSFLRRGHRTGRYEAHELLRQFAQERLELKAEATLAAHAAHAAYFADFMDRISQDLRSGRQKATLDEIESDIENIRAAWRYLAARGNAAEIAKLVDSLWFFHDIRGWYHAGVELFGEAEAALQSTADEEVAAVVASQMKGTRAFYMSLLGQVQQSKVIAQESIASLRRFKRQEEQLIPLQGLTTSEYFLHQIPAVMHAAQDSLEIARQLDDEWWEAAALAWLGDANAAAGEFDDAEHYAKAAAELLSEPGDPWLSYFPRQTLARVAELRGDFLAAKEQFQVALEDVESINFKRGMVYVYRNLGDVCHSLGEFPEAEQYYLQGLEIGHEIGLLREIFRDICGLARVWAAYGRDSEALELLAVVLQHPASEQHYLTTQTTIRNDAERLRSELKAALQAEEYASAWQRGNALELETVVAELLA